MDEIDPRDALLQAHVPAVMVPRYSAITALTGNGHRYLVAQDGLWIEVKRPWLHLLWPIAPSPAPLPYGPLEDAMVFAFDWDAFDALLAQFEAEAIRALPNEHASCFVWDEKDQTLRYRAIIAKSAGPSGIELHRPALAAHEHLAVDVHSHGALGAYFSATDDADDAGEVKLSAVLGNLDSPGDQTIAMRLCAQSLFIPFADESEAACRVCGCTETTPCEGGCAWVEPDLCSACAFNKD
jgi:PRTRC genetic system protein A